MTTTQDLAIFYQTFTDSFTCVSDPRVRQSRVLHPIDTLLFMGLTAVVAGADCFSEIVEYAEDNKEWFEKVLDIPNGIPSHGTFWNVFGLIDPNEFEMGFATWISTIQLDEDNKYRAIDGKALRGTGLPGDPRSYIHTVSMWACEAGLTLGQIQVDDKSNEITAIPDLLDLIDIQGCTVTIDAMGTQKAIASKIRENHGDYILALKGNQATLYEEVAYAFKVGAATEWAKLDGSSYRSEEKAHGRHETRLLVSIPIPSDSTVFHEWEGIQSISMLISKRESKKQSSIEVRYFISSLPADSARQIAYGVRSHWGIENRCHWTLDVGFSEDTQAAKALHVAPNLSIVRRMAQNIVKSDTTSKSSVRGRRKRAGRNNKYLETLISSFLN